jgi:hypothetical protein
MMSPCENMSEAAWELKYYDGRLSTIVGHQVVEMKGLKMSKLDLREE